MRNRLSFTLLLLAFVGTLSSASRASAQSDAEQRRVAFEKGWDALEAKNYQEAYRILSALFAEKPTYDVALNLGAAEFQLAKYQQAATHLDYGVRNAPPGEDAETLERSRQGLERVKQRYVGTLNVSTERSGAEVRLNGAVLGSTPLAAPVFVNPGRHKLELILAGFQPSTRDLQVSAGQELSVILNLGAPVAQAGAPDQTSASAQGEPASQDSGLSARTIALISGAAVTAIAGTTAIVFGVQSSAADKRAQDLAETVEGPCLTPGQSASCEALQNELDDRNSASKVANIALVVTAVAAVGTGAMFFLWPTKEDKRAGALRFHPLANLTTAGLVLDGNF